MIPAIVLAAGLSSRMGGRPKALLPLSEGQTFISRIVQAFLDAGVDDVVVVAGHEADAVASSLRQGGALARLVVNDHYRTGQFSSVLCGLDAIDRPGVTAMLMTLVDVPLVSSSTIRAVVQRFRETNAPIVRPVRGSEHGHPVLISRPLFDVLRRADPAKGAKPVVRAHVSLAGDVALDDDGAFRDIDTQAEYARLVAESRSH